MNNLQDLNQFRSNFTPVVNELAARTDSRRLLVSDNSRRLRNRLDIADQQTSSIYNENASRKDYYSMGDSYIHDNSYRTAVGNHEVRNPNQCPQFQSHLAQSPDSPLSVRRQRRPLGPRSENSPNCESVSLGELHRVIRGLKPVNIPRDDSSSVQDSQPWKEAPELRSFNVQDYQPWKAAPELRSSNVQDYQPLKAAPELRSSNVQDYQSLKAAPELRSSNVQDYQPWKAAPELRSSNVQDCQTWEAAPELRNSTVQDYKPWEAEPELLSSRDLTGNNYVWKNRGIAANYSRRPEVRDGAIVSLADLQTAIKLLKPVSKESSLTENSLNQSFTRNDSSLHDARCDFTPKTVPIKREELQDPKEFFKITVKELELRIQSLKSVGRVYYPQLQTTFYDDIKEKPDENLRKEREATRCDDQDTCDEICKIDTVEKICKIDTDEEICKIDTVEVVVSQVIRKKKRSFLSRLKFWRKGSKEIKQTTCEVMTTDNSDKGQENATEALKEKTPSISAKISSLFSCCVKGVSTTDDLI